MKNNILLFVFFITIFAACVRPPDYPIEPKITFVSVTDKAGNKKSSILQDGIVSRDTMYLNFTFTDGDGDIGVLNDSSLFIVDLRDNTRENAARGLPIVPEQGAKNGISGEMRIQIKGTCCHGIEFCQPSKIKPLDTVRYQIYIKDRAGHESNREKTEPITVLCK